MSDQELWMGPSTDEALGVYVGQTMLERVHSQSECAGWHCALHNPSDHCMREWRMVYRADRRIMERTCPHGVGHPDPDDVAYHSRVGRDGTGVHGCDGCCREETE